MTWSEEEKHFSISARSKLLLVDQW